jgi:hypothetical protein
MEEEMSENETTLKSLVDKAGPNRMICCEDIGAYFQEVAQPAYQLGLDRSGSGQRKSVDGREYMMDTWVLPDGTTIQAGYPG